MRKPPYQFDFNLSQAGVTLLLAILVLSAVLAVSVSLATIMYVEVRTSGDLLHTEVSYYGGSAAIEEGIYKVKRKIDQNGGPEQCDVSLPNCYSPNVGAVSLNTIPPIEDQLNDPVISDIIPQGATMSSATSFPASAKSYPLYNPSNITGGSNYGQITVSYLPTGNTDHLQVYLCQFDPSYSIGPGTNQYSSLPCSDPSNTQYWLVAGGDLYSGNSPQTWLLDGTKQQQLILFDPGNTGPVYVQISTYDAALNPKGMPNFEKTTIDVNAQSAGINRKIRVQIPNN